MLRVGLVGCGFMGRMHANVYGALDTVELVAAYDKDVQIMSDYCAQFGCARAESFESLVDSEIDIVDICLPTHEHSRFTCQAARAKKHVFCEKPMALTLEQADDMTRTCRESGVKLMIGHCIRFWPEYVHLKQVVDSKSLGRLLSLNLTRYGQFPSWSADNWLADESKAGGGVLDMHIHDTDFAHFLLGEPDSMVSVGTIDHTGPAQVFTTMKFGETVVHTEGGWNLPTHTPFKMTFRAIFERGAAIMEGGPYTIYEPGKEPHVPHFEKLAASGGGNISDLGGYYHEIKYFVDQVKSGRELETVTPESSRQSLATTLREIAMIKGG
ncbi:MAG: Gfo/Idh/MocA family oxidoreductase [Chthonomonadaceae bacterium]|nr:Gfo/Idh/MocA family oxidoreductase [Chthonomonadaceae bacterium]